MLNDITLRTLTIDDAEDVAKCLASWGADIDGADLLRLYEFGDLFGGRHPALGLQAIVSAVDFGGLCWVQHASAAAHADGMKLGALIVDYACGMFQPDARGIGIDAAPEFAGLLATLGFHESAGILRMRASRTIAAERETDQTPAVIRPMEETDIGEIVLYEEDLIGGDRSDVLIYLYESSVRLAYLATVGQWVAGFVLTHPTDNGIRVGPLLAEDDEIARALLRRVLASTDRPVVLDVLAQHAALIDWLRRIGFEPVSTSVRMFKSSSDWHQDTDRYFITGGPAFG